MFTGFDYDVIARSLSYLWQGMLFTLGLTFLSMPAASCSAPCSR